MKKNLEFYKKFLEIGFIPTFGLCNCAKNGLIDDVFLAKLTPNSDDENKIFEKGLSIVFWASGLMDSDMDCATKFTPLRQTIVLFMAALAGELDDL